jgi:hypothetical protein
LWLGQPYNPRRRVVQASRKNPDARNAARVASGPVHCRRASYAESVGRDATSSGRGVSRSAIRASRHKLVRAPLMPQTLGTYPQNKWGKCGFRGAQIRMDVGVRCHTSFSVATSGTVSQARCRGFESHRPLHRNQTETRMPSGFRVSEARLSLRLQTAARSFAWSSWRRKLGFRRAQALAQCVETRSVLCRCRRLASALADTLCLLDQPAALRASRDSSCLSDQLASLLASRSADGVPNRLPSRRTGCKPDCPAKRRRHEQTLAS